MKINAAEPDYLIAVLDENFDCVQASAPPFTLLYI
jgi:hypothetical protein